MFLAILMSGSPARPSGSICRRCIAWHLSDRHHRSELFQRSSLDDQIAFRGFLKFLWDLAWMQTLISEEVGVGRRE